MAFRSIALLSLWLVSSALWAAGDWSSLSPAEQRALSPLAQRDKWRAVVDSFDSLTPDEQARVQSRMRSWSRLSPNERARALEQYRALRSIPPERREALQEKWQEYQQLSPEERARAQSKRGGKRQQGSE